jgi:two-component system chemotaxis response regulator CheB
MAEIRVMIVDDSAMMRMLLQNIVCKIPGAQVVALCENGMVALQQLPNARPTLIMSDIEMPVMDGLTFLRQARTRTKVPIVILSSVANPGNPNVEKARSLGATAVLAKPSGSVSYDLEERLGASLQRIIKGFGAAA